MHHAITSAATGSNLPNGQEFRRHPRLRIAAMYSLLRVRLAGDSRYRWTGYIYDISQTGMRFELDQPLEAGTTLEVRVMLPGASHVTFNAVGTIIRLHDDEAACGPVRMGMMFSRFPREADRDRLAQYLSLSGVADLPSTKVA